MDLLFAEVGPASCANGQITQDWAFGQKRARREGIARGWANCGGMTSTPSSRQHVLPETRGLALLGCFDLLATIFLLGTHRAHEANWLMAEILWRFGPGGFALVKALMLGVPLVIAECARRQSPVFVQRALRVGLVSYVLLLLLAYRAPLLALLGPRA